MIWLLVFTMLCSAGSAVLAVRAHYWMVRAEAARRRAQTAAERAQRHRDQAEQALALGSSEYVERQGPPFCVCDHPHGGRSRCPVHNPGHAVMEL